MKQYTQMALSVAVCSAWIIAVLTCAGCEMGILKSIFGKREVKSEDAGKKYINLAFVLLSEAQPPNAKTIEKAFNEFAAPGESLKEAKDDPGEGTGDQAILLELNSGEHSIVALMPVPVPDGEADEGAKYSLSSFQNGWSLPSHNAHLMVTFGGRSGSPPVVELSRFTSLLAAVTKASPSVGVYWGDAGATHDPDFFMSIAADQGIIPRIMLWTGVSVVRQKDGRLSLLSLGMEQLNLPDLLLIAGESSEDTALETMFDLLAYVADRGEALPDGDTLGRSADEKFPVRYVKSPVDSSVKVWSVELP